MPVTIAVSGSTAAAGDDETLLVAVVRPAGGIPCQSSEGNDGQAAGSSSKALFFGYGGFGYPGTGLSAGSFDDTAEFNPPAPGSYLVCAWIDDQGPGASETTTASTSTTFSARGPQVEQLTVSLPTPPKPNVAFQIAYTTQTDQQLSLYSTIKPAGGLPCASSYELETAQNQDETNLLSGGYWQSIFGGPTTATTTTTEKKGSYVICSWIEGPNQQEVDAATSTSISVTTPPPCVVPTIGSKSSLATVEGQLTTARCAPGTVVEEHSKTVPTGDVIKLDRKPRTKLGTGAKVGIVVSSGPPPKRHRHKH